MKKIILLSVLCLISFTGISAATPIKSIEVKTNAVCETCSNTIYKALMKTKGVQSVEINLETSLVNVYYNTKKINEDQIRVVITKAGYNADDLKADEEARKNLPDCCRNPEKH